MLAILRRGGTGDKRKPTGSTEDDGGLRVEGFERKVTAYAVGADAFEIAVGDDFSEGPRLLPA